MEDARGQRETFRGASDNKPSPPPQKKKKKKKKGGGLKYN